MKKVLFFTFCLFLVTILSGCIFNKEEAPAEQEKGYLSPAKATPVPTQSSQLVIEGKPYLALTPRADGKELKLSLGGIVGAKSMDYELVYLAGETDNQLQRGVVGSVDLAGSTEYGKSLLLGSCSKSVCKYDENVKEGTVSLIFRGDGGAQKYEAVFRLQTGQDAKTGLTSGDGNFKFVSSTLPPSNYYLTVSTLGLFRMPVGRIVAGPYGIFTSGSTSAKGKVFFKPSSPAQAAKILVWAGQSWTELKSTREDEFVTAETPTLGAFVAVVE
ncbi:hypothetical protein FJZ40_02715 [Candidatus Shapirobacteria bacterium]|nr:hypothetical protein [Candidatus Shapirobacteria bacterium]